MSRYVTPAKQIIADITEKYPYELYGVGCTHCLFEDGNLHLAEETFVDLLNEHTMPGLDRALFRQVAIEACRRLIDIPLWKRRVDMALDECGVSYPNYPHADRCALTTGYADDASVIFQGTADECFAELHRLQKLLYSDAAQESYFRERLSLYDEDDGE